MTRPLMILAAVALAVGMGTALVVASAGGSGTTALAPDPPLATASPSAGPDADADPSTATTPPAPVTPTPTPTATAIPSSDVAAAQQRLTDLGYYAGAVDGVAGPATASAVQAFQKVQRLTADGVIGPNTVAAMAAPVTPQLRGGPADRVEVDLDRQVLYLVEGGALTRILPISSGSGETYAQPGGGTARSVTPVGDFRIERHISGERNAPLGTLYDPMYFYGGWAIHGSNSVPSYPASHGCVRVTRADAVWLFDRLPIGTTVSLYGNTNAFSPELGESAGTDAPAGDTPDTTPDDGIQTEAPTPPSAPPATTPQPPAPPAPTSPSPTTPAPTNPPPSTPPPSTPEPPEPTPPTARPTPPTHTESAEPAAAPLPAVPDEG